MNEPIKKKAWVVGNVYTTALEDHLNKLADDSYQVFKVERGLSGDGWLVIAFDPVQISERMTANMSATLSKMAGLVPVSVPPSP